MQIASGSHVFVSAAGQRLAHRDGQALVVRAADGGFDEVKRFALAEAQSGFTHLALDDRGERIALGFDGGLTPVYLLDGTGSILAETSGGQAVPCEGRDEPVWLNDLHACAFDRVAPVLWVASVREDGRSSLLVFDASTLRLRDEVILTEEAWADEQFEIVARPSGHGVVVSVAFGQDATGVWCVELVDGRAVARPPAIWDDDNAFRVAGFAADGDLEATVVGDLVVVPNHPDRDVLRPFTTLAVHTLHDLAHVATIPAASWSGPPHWFAVLPGERLLTRNGGAVEAWQVTLNAPR